MEHLFTNALDGKLTGIGFATGCVNTFFMAVVSAVVKPWVKPVAQAGLMAKGVVYLLLGAIGFAAAAGIGGKQSSEATQTGALQTVKDLPAGTVLLLVLAVGLLCYSIWRGIQTAYNTGGEKTKWTKRVRYLFSALAYLALAYAAFRLATAAGGNKGDSNQQLAAELLDKPFGKFLVGAAALALAGVGGYQIYYGLSEKYKKHVQGLSLQSKQAATLLTAGKVGYISRGAVWLVIAYLFGRAAWMARASEAGSTGKAFRVVEGSPFGAYLLGALGLGMVAYGVFNFVRARYERLR